MIHKIRYLLLAFSALFLLIPGITPAASAEPEPLPNLTLTVPNNDDYLSYLEIKGTPGEKFTFEDIDADILLIQLFSMYCPFCQEEALNVNALYEAMLQFSKPEFKVKMIGLGANNSEFEIDHFRKTYDVRFPLFPDQNMTMYKTLGGKGTPGFIVCKREKDNHYTIVLRQSGGFFNPEEFLNQLLHKSGYN